MAPARVNFWRLFLTVAWSNLLLAVASLALVELGERLVRVIHGP